MCRLAMLARVVTHDDQRPLVNWLQEFRESPIQDRHGLAKAVGVSSLRIRNSIPDWHLLATPSRRSTNRWIQDPQSATWFTQEALLLAHTAPGGARTTWPLRRFAHSSFWAEAINNDPQSVDQ